MHAILVGVPRRPSRSGSSPIARMMVRKASSMVVWEGKGGSDSGIGFRFHPLHRATARSRGTCQDKVRERGRALNDDSPSKRLRANFMRGADSVVRQREAAR